MTKESTREALLREIEKTFPKVEMPERSELLLAQMKAVGDSDLLVRDLEELRGKLIDGAAIRSVHQELSFLSAATWRWLLPHYLSYCLTDEAAYNRFETEFLIYNLGPTLEFQRNTQKRLALLNKSQLACLIHFLKWCLEDEEWKDLHEENIARAISFIETVAADRSATEQ
jgi:hypothetical protein